MMARLAGIVRRSLFVPVVHLGSALMARLARIVVPGLAHHVTQRGNRREPIFFEPGDQEVYRGLLAEQVVKARVAIFSECAR